MVRDVGGGNILSSLSIWLIGNYLQLVSLQRIPLEIIFFVNVKSHIKKKTNLDYSSLCFNQQHVSL